MDRKRSRHLGAEERPSGLTRRSMLALSSTAVLAAALPYGRAQSLSLPLAAEGASVSPVMEKLSAYMSAAAERAVPGEVQEKAQEHIADTLAAIISGSRLTPGQIGRASC